MLGSMFPFYSGLLLHVVHRCIVLNKFWCTFFLGVKETDSVSKNLNLTHVVLASTHKSIVLAYLLDLFFIKYIL